MDDRARRRTVVGAQHIAIERRLPLDRQGVTRFEERVADRVGRVPIPVPRSCSATPARRRRNGLHRDACGQSSPCTAAGSAARAHQLVVGGIVALVISAASGHRRRREAAGLQHLVRDRLVEQGEVGFRQRHRVRRASACPCPPRPAGDRYPQFADALRRIEVGPCHPAIHLRPST